MTDKKRKTTDESYVFPTPFLGRFELVQNYHEQNVDFFRGNPLIEVLPPELTDAEFAKKITYHIPVTKQQRSLPIPDRDHYIEHIRRFYHPLKKAYDTHRQISRQIRGAYVGRNPTNIRFWPEIREIAERMKTATPEEIIDILEAIQLSQKGTSYTGASTSALIGVSGMGKTMLTKRILELLSAQVYFHSHYKGNPFPFQQIVWLFIECPSNASIKSFLAQILFTIDMIMKRVDGIGTNYYRDIARDGLASAENMILPVSMVLLSHGVSLIIGDEMQNVNLATSGGEQRLLNLLVRMCNTLGISIMLVATPEAIDIFSERYRMMRRASQQGNPLWERAREADMDWNMFVNALWEHQYLYRKTSITPEARSALYRASAGITEVAVRIFQFAQRRAIAYAIRKSEEIITVDHILSVQEEELGLEKSVLKALQEGKEALIDVRDVRTKTPEVITKPNDSPTNPPPKNTKPTGHRSNLNSTTKYNLEATDPKMENALLIAKGESSDPKAVYENIKKAGFVRSAIEFWD